MKAGTSLRRYREKRHFDSTPEPPGNGAKTKGAGQLHFVVQKHAASHLHYDFRLEMDGVLKSWAVPKGIPTALGEKHLAIKVEDHPLPYGGFEGVIAPGNYGAGTVMVWDSGTYDLTGAGALQGLRQGKLEFQLNGKKLKSRWTLVRMRNWNGKEDGKEHWLLLKAGESIRPITPLQDDSSALSGRSMRAIAATSQNGNGQAKGSQSVTPKSSNPSGKKPGGKRSTRAVVSKEPATKAGFVSPMKALLSATLPESADWIFEIKFDGIRLLSVRSENETRIYSRIQRDVTKDYPEIAAALETLSAQSFVLDGEVVALDQAGRSSFQLLQNAAGNREARDRLYYYVFDLPYLNGRNLGQLPLLERKALLKSLLKGGSPRLRFSGNLEGTPSAVWKGIQKLGLEGVIAKKRDSHYEPGRRSGSWLKIKAVMEQEFVIGGYTAPQGARRHFGSLLVGYYARGKLIFASKVGTGFDGETLAALHQEFQQGRTGVCPFEKGSLNMELGAAAQKRCEWLAPRWICQVKFMEWTEDGRLRHPVFLGLRADKNPREVRRESPAR